VLMIERSTSCSIRKAPASQCPLPQITEFPKPEFMSKSLQELQIGTYANIAMVRTTTPVYVALGIFVQHRVSALPVVDEKGERLGKKREAAWVASLSQQPNLEGNPMGPESFGYHTVLFY
jgi:hypothetical protein